MHFPYKGYDIIIHPVCQIFVLCWWRVEWWRSLSCLGICSLHNNTNHISTITIVLHSVDRDCWMNINIFAILKEMASTCWHQSLLRVTSGSNIHDRKFYSHWHLVWYRYHWTSILRSGLFVSIKLTNAQSERDIRTYHMHYNWSLHFLWNENEYNIWLSYKFPHIATIWNWQDTVIAFGQCFEKMPWHFWNGAVGYWLGYRIRWSYHVTKQYLHNIKVIGICVCRHRSLSTCSSFVKYILCDYTIFFVDGTFGSKLWWCGLWYSF